MVFPIMLAAFLSLIGSPRAQAWGRRGHAIVCETAANLLSQKEDGKFLARHTFDLGYYCNVPDFIWKKPASYDREWTNHFIDLEIFDRAFRSSPVKRPFSLDRKTFNHLFPEVPQSAGRSYWRIREVESKLKVVTEMLGRKDLSTKEHQNWQGEWLVDAGIMGHYIGDLSQPLHVTENHDGQLNDQKGIHSFFEDILVDELFSGLPKGKAASLEAEVNSRARSQWPSYHKKSSKLSDLEILQNLAESSLRDLPQLLKTDKSIGRKDIGKALAAHKPMIVNRMAAGSLALAEIWSRFLGWPYDGEKFYFFDGSPKYIEPEQVSEPLRSTNP
jgi:hypothetical protein